MGIKCVASACWGTFAEILEYLIKTNFLFQGKGRIGGLLRKSGKLEPCESGHSVLSGSITSPDLVFISKPPSFEFM